MDRRAEQRSLDDRPSLERPRERVALEAVEPRPQPDVHRRRVLRLDTPDPPERLRQRVPGALEQQLAGEQRPVELLLAEGALGLGHRQALTETLR
jgi:hypothetical protein